MESTKILIIEDEESIAKFIELELRCEGYQVTVCNDGMSGLMKAREINPDLIILDRMLPNMDGLEVCKRIKQTTHIPIIMLTAKGEVFDKIEGLDSGANDYMVKPFNLEELLARVRAHLRVYKPKEKTVVEFADIVINTQSREVKRDNRSINLSPKEYDLLLLFMNNPRHVLLRDKILEKVWGWDFEGEDNILEVYIHGLRDKLEFNGKNRVIQTVRGVGYVLKEI